MFEYWACFGLACIDDEFLKKLEDASNGIGKDKVIDVVKAYGFRFSHFELAELEYILKNRRDVVVPKMKEINCAMCPPPPRPCPCSSASSIDLYDQYRNGHRDTRDRSLNQNR
jgi:hypothetical protein